MIRKMITRTLAALSALTLLTSCITLPHRPTPGWQCQAQAPSGHARASADLATDGSLILALWSWNMPGYALPYAVAAYSGDGNARRYDAPTTGVVRLPPAPGKAELALAHMPGEDGWQAAIARGSAKGLRDEVTIDWDRLTALARQSEPVWVLRRHATGLVKSVEVSKDEILAGERALAEVRAALAAMVADPANQCVKVDDLYPEIIVT